ncbi:hypothetical protein C0995_006938 [Termitomyces sp. Mi166|nr:hypothetical protein C0995_006938 [Termitomyces sp. Mi166\
MSAKKASKTKVTAKRAAKATSTHPSYVEDKYKLDIGPAQTTQLSRTLATWSEKGVFVLPKGNQWFRLAGPSGRVRLAPKSRTADSSASKENKPAAKPKATAKPKAAEKSSTSKAATTKPTSRSAIKSAPKTYSMKGRSSVARKAAAPAAKAMTIKKPMVKSTKPATAAKKAAFTKKVLTGKAKTATTTTAKKTTVTSKRGSAKKGVTGTTATTKAKTAAKKASVKKVIVTKSTTKPAARGAAKPAVKAKAKVKATPKRKYIMLATVARPVPADPYNPLPLPDDPGVVHHPSPFVPIRLPIFALVIWLNDMIVRILSLGAPRKRLEHTRSLSDTTNIVEEGKPIRLKEISRTTMRPTRDRVNIGRRKID